MSNKRYVFMEDSGQRKAFLNELGPPGTNFFYTVWPSKEDKK